MRQYTSAEDARIRAELKAIERELKAPRPQVIRTNGDLATDKRFLMVENAELHKAFAKASVEARRLRKQLQQRPAWAWIGWFAAFSFLISTIALLYIIGRI